MKVTMMAPKISAISEDFAFDRITSSIGPATPEMDARKRAKLPSARLLGKLDTLEKPGERIKKKRREGAVLPAGSKGSSGFHPQALSRADLRDRPAGDPVRHLLRQGEEGHRAQPGRSRDHRRDGAGRAHDH